MKYDLHIHTHYSPCSNLKPKTILKKINKLKFGGIAVVDHHTMKGGLAVKKLNKNKNLEVILGSEVKTEYGEVLIFYQQEEIKERKLLDVLDRVKQQDALVSIAHPFRPVPWQSFRYPFEKIKGKIDAIETFNSRNALFGNYRAQKLAKLLKIAETGGSDAHFWFDLGNGMTVFEGDLRTALKQRKTKVYGTTSLTLLTALCSVVNKRIVRKLF